MYRDRHLVFHERRPRRQQVAREDLAFLDDDRLERVIINVNKRLEKDADSFAIACEYFGAKAKVLGRHSQRFRSSHGGSIPALVYASNTLDQSGDGFLRDVVLALRAWGRDPRLPALTLAIAVLSLLPSLLTSISRYFSFLSFLLLPVGLFSIGFYGAQRIWYLRIFRGERIEFSEVWSMRVTWRRPSWSFARRLLPAAPPGAIPGCRRLAVGALHGALSNLVVGIGSQL
jgi:hypothetical protein